VLTVGDGVYGFTLDPYVGEFVLTHNRIQVRTGGAGRVNLKLGSRHAWRTASSRTCLAPGHSRGIHTAQ
jgi:fructose-1,6-bisphosphatase